MTGLDVAKFFSASPLRGVSLARAFVFHPSSRLRFKRNLLVLLFAYAPLVALIQPSARYRFQLPKNFQLIRLSSVLRAAGTAVGHFSGADVGEYGPARLKFNIDVEYFYAGY